VLSLADVPGRNWKEGALCNNDGTCQSMLTGGGSKASTRRRKNKKRHHHWVVLAVLGDPAFVLCLVKKKMTREHVSSRAHDSD